MKENNYIKEGLKQLAFGKCNDAVFLAFAEELPPPSLIENLDLFNVSEIKRVKGGGVEIKLFDRLEALEKLYEIENSSESNDRAEKLINALALSAKGGEENGVFGQADKST